MSTSSSPSSISKQLFIERIIEEFFNETGRCYSFAHFSFQEYYCGRRLASLLISGDGEAEAVIRRFRSDDRFSLVFQFVVGTLGGRRDSGEVMRRVFEVFVSDECDVRRFGYLCTLLDAGKCSHVMSDGSPFRVVVDWLGSVFTDRAVGVSRHNIGATGMAVVSAICGKYCIGSLSAHSCITALADMLRVNTTLTTFSISDSNITSRGAAALADALRVNSTLKALDMSLSLMYNAGAVNFIGDDGASALAEMLRVNTTLTALNIRNNNITSRGAAALADMLRVNTTLTALNISKNSITSRGAAALADVLCVNSTLKTLDMSENSSVGVDGVRSISKSLFHNTVLNGKGAAALADALRHNTTLRELNLSDNSITSAGGRVLLEAVKHHNTTLRELNLDDNHDCDKSIRAEIYGILKRHTNSYCEIRSLLEAKSR